MARKVNQHLVAAQTLTAAGSTGALPNLSGADSPTISALIRIPNAPTGTTPMLNLSLDVSPDGTNWFSVASQNAIAAVTNVRLVATGVIEPFVRVSWTVSGTTPSFSGVTTLVLM